MPSSTQARLTVSLSKQTDRELRSWLGQQGAKRGDLSKFVEEAVLWRMFDRTVSAIKERNKDADQDALQTIIDETVREVRLGGLVKS